MKKSTIGVLLVIGCLTFVPRGTISQETNVFRIQVQDFIHKHYLHGINYQTAKALGPTAIPYLVEMLNVPQQKEFWVNIIVTLGFIEDSSAFDALVMYLESCRGAVDEYTFRALISVPFAIGCIASNGDPGAMRYLINLVDASASAPLVWSFQGQDCRRLLAEKATIGLAVSGRTEARVKLLAMKKQMDKEGVTSTRQYLIDHVREGLDVMDRIADKGRASVFNPPQDNQKEGSKP